MREDPTAPGVAARFKSDRVLGAARRLRKVMTPAEQTLWFQLRRLPLSGSHFRRQTPIGPFIADFMCHGARLVVELDGGAHGAPDVALRDLERQEWIEGRSYLLLRFTNAEVMHDAKSVARRIFAEAKMRMPRD
jgi:very-short-patch-repair endonuclease